MDDLTPCPFGAHKDLPMQDVPASWLVWFHNKVYRDIEIDIEPDGDRLEVYQYCREHLHDIAQDCDEDFLGMDDISITFEEEEVVDDPDQLQMKEEDDDDVEE